MIKLILPFKGQGLPSIALHKTCDSPKDLLLRPSRRPPGSSALLRRSPLSSPAAAWPCRGLLMKPAPLSERFNFLVSYHRLWDLSTDFEFFVNIVEFVRIFSSAAGEIAPRAMPDPCHTQENHQGKHRRHQESRL